MAQGRFAEAGHALTLCAANLERYVRCIAVLGMVAGVSILGLAVTLIFGREDSE